MDSSEVKLAGWDSSGWVGRERSSPRLRASLLFGSGVTALVATLFTVAAIFSGAFVREPVRALLTILGGVLLAEGVTAATGFVLFTEQIPAWVRASSAGFTVRPSRTRSTEFEVEAEDVSHVVRVPWADCVGFRLNRPVRNGRIIIVDWNQADAILRSRGHGTAKVAAEVSARLGWERQ